MAKSVKALREAARRCRSCSLWANATQTVFGAGDPHARVMLVGEQPGDEEEHSRAFGELVGDLSLIRKG